MIDQIPTSNPEYFKVPNYIVSMIDWCVPFDLRETIVNTALKPQLFAAYPHNQIFS
jgi:hypothetical protein